MLECGSKLVKAEGVGALWKGFLPAYIKHRPRRGNEPSTRVEDTSRLAPHTVISFIVLDNLTRALTGRDAL